MVISFITGIGILLFGIHIMSTYFEKICGNRIRKRIAKYDKSIVKNTIFGLILDVFLQSSTASVALIMGLTGIGVVSLLQSICLIIGSNIGSAINVFLVAFQEINIIGYFGILVLIGIILRLFTKNTTIKNWGMSLCGLGLVFVGLSIMSDASSELSTSQNFINFFTSINNPAILFFLGLIVSAFINSSLGTTAIIASIFATSPNLLSLQNASYIIYAMNIGTCFTLILIGLTSKNRQSIKSSLSYLIFNCVGALIFCPLTIYDWITPCTSFLNNPTLQIIFVNLIFNVVTTIIMLPLAKPLTKLLDKILPNKVEEIPQEISTITTLGLVQLNSNAINYFDETCDKLKLSIDYVIKNESCDLSEFKQSLYNLIDTSKQMNAELLKIGGELSDEDESTKIDLNNVFIGIEKTNTNILKLINSCTYQNTRVNFTQKQLATITSMKKIVLENIDDMKIIIEESLMHEASNDKLLNNVIERLEELVKIKIKAKKSIILETVSMENKIKKYSAFLNVINYFEEISTNLTDIILNVLDVNANYNTAENVADKK